MERESAQILRDGLPALRPSPRPDGHPMALTTWQGAGYGAVLWLRWLRNGEFEAECVVLRQDRDGEWTDYATSSSGGGWYPCVDADAAAWRRLDEDPGHVWITWCDDGTTPVDDRESAANESVLRIASGFVVPAIAALRVSSATVEPYLVHAQPGTGAVLLGMIGPDSPHVTPLDAAGAELHGPGGPIVVDDLAAHPDGLVPCGTHSSHVGEFRDTFGPDALGHPDVADSPERALDLHLGERAGGSPGLSFTRAGTEPAAVTFHGRTDDGVVHAVVTAEQVGGPDRWLVSFARECAG